MSCANRKKTVSPKCEELSHCQWVVGKGCKHKPQENVKKVLTEVKKPDVLVNSTCSGRKKTVNPKCEDLSNCKWVVGKGCQDKPQENIKKVLTEQKKPDVVVNSTCAGRKKTVNPKCEDNPNCRWVVGKGCKDNAKQPAQKHIDKMPLEPKVVVNKPKSKEVTIFTQSNEFNQIMHNNNNFSDVNQYGELKRIGAVSANGAIYYGKYNNNDCVIKINVTHRSDSLMYEYLAGLCVNEFSDYYPIFPKTYALYTFDFIGWNQNSKMISINKLANYIGKVDDKMIQQGCKSGSKNYIISTQFLPIFKSFGDYVFFGQNSKRHVCNILGHLTYLYSCLSGLKDKFTHYDLHHLNVNYINLDNKYVTIKIHSKHNKLVQFNSVYMPVIIDFGRSYVNCDQVETGDISEKLIKLCHPDVGLTNGWVWMGNYNRHTKKYVDNTGDYINIRHKNISHDLRLLSILDRLISQSRVSPKIKHIVDNMLRKVLFTEMFGTAEQLQCDQSKPICNVEGAASYLQRLMNEKEITKHLEELVKGRAKYGTLEIWEDMSHPFKLTCV